MLHTIRRNLKRMAKLTEMLMKVTVKGHLELGLPSCCLTDPCKIRTHICFIFLYKKKIPIVNRLPPIKDPIITPINSGIVQLLTPTIGRPQDIASIIGKQLCTVKLSVV